MTPATADTFGVENGPTVRDRAIDAVRNAAHISHEVRLLKSLAADAVEDATHAARRTLKSLKRRVDDAGDLRDEAARRVRRQPLKAVGVAVGVGLIVGVAVGWIGGRFGKWGPPRNC